MNYFGNFFKGIIIGIGNIAPGVSGGALAMILGLYEDMVSAVGNFFKNMKRNLIFLFPIGLGAAIGIVGFSNILSYLLEKLPMPTTYTFAGLIVGTLPLLVKRANRRGFKVTYLIPFVLTLITGLTLAFLETGFGDIQAGALHSVNLFQLVFGGFVLAGSIVIPGISGSVLLMLLGFYESFLRAVASLDLVILFPMGIGLAVGVLVFAKFMDYLLREYYGITYYAVLGFVIGAIPEIITGYSFDWLGLVSVFCFFGGLAISYALSRLERL
ncbi:MAG: DUF368 domain-containing protein [Peptococcaceae bacterium]|jgi:putative membrane protein|nr:DUF368 domain-containing protein [Peptococcaceae bacterium]